MKLIDLSIDTSQFYRSEEMELTQLFLQPDIAFEIIASLGEAGIAQFVDLNEGTSAFQRKFVAEVKKCNEMDRKLKYIESELNKDNIFISEGKNKDPKTLSMKELNELEIYLSKIEKEVRHLSDNYSQLNIDHVQLLEGQEVLTKARTFFNTKEESSILEVLQGDEGTGTLVNNHLDFVAGVIDREKLASFERILWRVGRGNIFIKQEPIQKPIGDPDTGVAVQRTVFIAFFQGEQLRSRIKKICAGFKVTIYKCPTNTAERENRLTDIKKDIQDLEMVLLQTKDFRARVLNRDMDKLYDWSLMVRKVKAIYFVMNMFNFDVTNRCFIAECWISKKEIVTAQKILKETAPAAENAMSSFLNIINTSMTPPTYIKTNKFTQGFQNLIESYSCLTYGEVNPGFFTLVTFPFLFAVMFGDMGHGLILMLAGAALCYYEKKLTHIKSEIFTIFYGGRYIILLMGFYSIYTGFIYNDVFSKSANIFGSSWSVNLNDTIFEEEGTVMLRPEYSYQDSPYPIGMDPIWMQSKNKIIFHNTYKMKMSIIMGIVHMIFGLSLSVVNAKKFNKPENIIFEFIPQIIFLLFLFAWLVVMMFIKWIQYSAFFGNNDHLSTHCAPSVLILFINMMLLKHYEPSKECNEYMFEYQEYVQMVLLVIAVICIPFMLVGKPIYIMMKRKRNGGGHKKPLPPSDEDNNNYHQISMEQSKKQHDEEEEEPMSEIFMHQGIHTIEYVLSTISHTASYLRLWALSLAHGELSEVLWSMVLRKSFMILPGYPGAAVLFFIFGIWSFLTLFILVMMEGLSAFLHTLRLHWVEFMSKFFDGAGYPFQPFCFRTIMDDEDNEESK